MCLTARLTSNGQQREIGPKARLMSSTRTPLTGNPLAVFTDARGLTDKEMQLWREMNLSETTFVLPRR